MTPPKFSWPMWLSCVFGSVILSTLGVGWLTRGGLYNSVMGAAVLTLGIVSALIVVLMPALAEDGP